MQEACTLSTNVAPLPSPPSLPSPDNRRNGKVAKLPKSTRDRINHFLEDGLTYARIIEQLGPEGRDLTLDNLSQWKKGGYQDWLRDQFWRQDMRSRQEAFTGLLAGAEPIQLPEAGLQLAVVGICELLRALSHGSSGDKADSDQYVRVANSLARLSRSILQLQQYRDTTANTKAAQLKRRDHKRAFNDTERDAFLDCADDLFGFKSARRLQAEAHQPATPAQTTDSQPAFPDSSPQISNPEISNPHSAPSPEIPNSQISKAPPTSVSSARQLSNPPVSNGSIPPNPSEILNSSPIVADSPSEISNPEISNPASPPSEISNPDPVSCQLANPEPTNSATPPPACSLCTLRPAPWLPTALPAHCLDCAHAPPLEPF